MSAYKEISKIDELQSPLSTTSGYESTKLANEVHGVGGEVISSNNRGLFIKVCGMRESQNVKDLANLNPDFIGFIFYEKSKRYVGNSLDINILNQLPANIKKVAVFVDEKLEQVVEIMQKYDFDYAQLHGNELVDFCEKLKEKNIKIIKAFSVDEYFDFEITNVYEKVADLFLFDTKTPEKGGSGQSFDWTILEKYSGETPFLLAGGIDESNFEIAKNIKHKSLFGLDINSKFELEPGLKDIEKLKKVINNPEGV
jgi:phosphoribosylanthranilate isomerase